MPCSLQSSFHFPHLGSCHECEGRRRKGPPGDRSGSQASVRCRGTSSLGGDGRCGVRVHLVRRPERAEWRTKVYVLIWHRPPVCGADSLAFPPGQGRHRFTPFHLIWLVLTFYNIMRIRGVLIFGGHNNSLFYFSPPPTYVFTRSGRHLIMIGGTIDFHSASPQHDVQWCQAVQDERHLRCPLGIDYW